MKASLAWKIWLFYVKKNERGGIKKEEKQKNNTAGLNGLGQWDLSLTHVHAHTRSADKNRPENGMGMFSAATWVADGNRWNGAH